MLLPDRHSEEDGVDRASGRASTPRHRSRSVRDGGRRFSSGLPGSRQVASLVILTAGLFVLATLVVVWLWSSVDPACENVELATVAPVCDPDVGEP